MKSKQECLLALQKFHKYGDVSMEKMMTLTDAERAEFQIELSTYYSGGRSDFERDETQAARLARLEADLAASV